jgi:predicted DNA-binding transcriptional regulator AlpA
VKTLPDTNRRRAADRPRLLSKAEVLDLIGVTYTTLWEWMGRDEFPRAIELGKPNGRSTKIAWYESEILDWIAARPRRRLRPGRGHWAT